MNTGFKPAEISRTNNFDLLRLYAAIEVMFFHIFPNMGVNVDFLRWPQIYLNGVMIFYFISGFLITQSYLRSPSIIQYAKNRMLRLTPALVCVWLFTVLSIMAFGKFGSHLFVTGRFWLWSFLHCTVWPGYHTGLFPDFANGGNNGALWTISTEISFYLLIPLVFMLFKKKSTYVLILLFILSAISNHYWHTFNPGPEVTGIKQWYWQTLGPYLWNFLVGAFFSLYWDKIKRFIEGKFLYYLAAYLLLIFVFGLCPAHTIGKFTTLIMNILLGFVVFSAAFTCKNAAKILKGKDISYGVYVYHFVIQNIFIELGLIGCFIYPSVVFFISIIIGLLSWNFIESKALSLKKKSLLDAIRFRSNTK